MNIYYKNYTDSELARYAADLPFQDDLVYELAERLYQSDLARKELTDVKRGKSRYEDKS